MKGANNHTMTHSLISVIDFSPWARPLFFIGGKTAKR
jgi:hypothetical protein